MSKFTNREIVPEIIDDFNWSGEDLQKNLEEIEWINKYLGGTKTSAQPVIKFIQQRSPVQPKPITIVDIGCGSGDVLKNIQSAFNADKSASLVGVDANLNIIDFALSHHFTDNKISFVHADVMNQEELIPQADVYMMNLFLHHFEMTEIKSLLGHLLSKTPQLVVINDLQRSPLAYHLFGALCRIQNASEVTKNDGKLSILKGFNKAEMRDIGQMVQGYQMHLKWQWAFRWQLLLTKI